MKQGQIASKRYRADEPDIGALRDGRKSAGGSISGYCLTVIVALRFWSCLEVGENAMIQEGNERTVEKLRDGSFTVHEVVTGELVDEWKKSVFPMKMLLPWES